MRAAILEVAPGAETFEPLALADGKLVAVEEGVPAEVYAVYDDAGDLVAYAIRGEGPGFQDTIGLIFGFDPVRGMVVGMQVLESRETPGLGDGIFKNAEFVGSFRSLTARPAIELVKKGTASAPHEVDGITGATISSKAVVKILNGSLDRWESHLTAGAPQPEA